MWLYRFTHMSLVRGVPLSTSLKHGLNHPNSLFAHSATNKINTNKQSHAPGFFQVWLSMQIFSGWDHLMCLSRDHANIDNMWFFTHLSLNQLKWVFLHQVTIMGPDQANINTKIDCAWTPLLTCMHSNIFGFCWFNLMSRDPTHSKHCHVTNCKNPSHVTRHNNVTWLKLSHVTYCQNKVTWLGDKSTSRDMKSQ